MPNSADWRDKELFDRALYERLDEETGGAGLEIAATLLSVAMSRRDALLEAARAGHGADMARIAHTAKSGARSVGLMRLAEFCDQIERHPPTDPAAMAAMCSDIEREFDAAISVMQSLQEE